MVLSTLDLVSTTSCTKLVQVQYIFHLGGLHIHAHIPRILYQTFPVFWARTLCRSVATCPSQVSTCHLSQCGSQNLSTSPEYPLVSVSIHKLAITFMLDHVVWFGQIWPMQNLCINEKCFHLSGMQTQECADKRFLGETSDHLLAESRSWPCRAHVVQNVVSMFRFGSQWDWWFRPFESIPHSSYLHAETSESDRNAYIRSQQTSWSGNSALFSIGHLIGCLFVLFGKRVIRLCFFFFYALFFSNKNVPVPLSPVWIEKSSADPVLVS